MLSIRDVRDDGNQAELQTPNLLKEAKKTRVIVGLSCKFTGRRDSKVIKKELGALPGLKISKLNSQRGEVVGTLDRPKDHLPKLLKLSAILSISKA